MPSNAINVRGIPHKFFTRTDNFERYLCDIRKYPILTPDEEVELINRYQKEGDMAARDKIIMCNQRFVYSVARRYADENTLMDLINECNLGLMDALDVFQCDRGFKFISFAVWYLRANISLFLNKKSIVHRSNYLRTCTLLHKVQNQFFVENGRLPEKDEIREIVAKQYSASVRDIESIEEVKAYSLDNPLQDTDDLAFIDSVEFNKFAPSENAYIDEINRDYLRTYIVEGLKCIPKREAAVLSYIFGVGDCDKPHTTLEAAQKFNLTTERIRQIKNSGFEHMKTSLARVDRREAV